MAKNTIPTMYVRLYKESLDFPLSAVDMPSYSYPETIRRIYKCLLPLIGQTTNMTLNLNQKHGVFIKDIIAFCKVEGINYMAIMQWQVIQDKNVISIVFNEGQNADVYTISI